MNFPPENVPTQADKKHLFERQKLLAEKELNKKLQKLKKRVEERAHVLNACKNWSQVYHEGLLLQANLYRMIKGMKEVIVSDWENEGADRSIVLNPLIPPHAQIAAYFKRSKKLRKGEGHTVRLLKAAEEELETYLAQQKMLAQVNTFADLESYHQMYSSSKPHSIKSNLLKKQIPKPYRLFKTQSGLEIRVGKNAKNNDLLTFRYSNGLDWWLHARNCPGSHVVIPFQKGKELDKESLLDAAELATRYSKGNENGDGEVCLTQIKYLARVKGVPGKVILSKHKVLKIVPDKERWLQIKNRVDL